MIEIMNRITDKVGWDVKVFDEKITQRWRKEAMEVEGRDVSEKMMDWVKKPIFIQLFMPTLGPCLLFIMRSNDCVSSRKNFSKNFVQVRDVFLLLQKGSPFFRFLTNRSASRSLSTKPAYSKTLTASRLLAQRSSPIPSYLMT